MQKHTIEDVRAICLSKGYHLLETEYKDSKVPMRYVCTCGNEAMARFDVLKTNKYCKKCVGKLYAHDCAEVKKAYKDRGSSLLTTSYKNNHTKMRFLCFCGKEHKATFRDFQKAKGCIARLQPPTYQKVQSYFSGQGCTLLETEYVDSNTSIRYICVCGREATTRWDRFRDGRRCHRCGGAKAAEKTRISQDEANAFFAEHDCILLTRYEHAQAKLEFVCRCGRIGCQSWDFLHGKTNQAGKLYPPRCKKCGNASRSGELHPLWKSDREMVALVKTISNRCGALIRCVYKLLGLRKTARTHKLLGYTRKELLKHITSHPNWSAVKNKKWHIDHIFPVSAFVRLGITDLKIINALDNLQPLLGEQNLAKSDKHNPDALKAWLKTKGIIDDI